MTAKGYCELDRAQLTKEQKLGLLLCANLSQGEKDVEDALTKTGRGRSFDLMLPSIAENARAVTEYGASIGIRTCTENHGRIAQDNDRLERLFNAVAHDNYGLLIDMGNFLFVDEDPVMAVSRLAPYAFHVHAKDFTKKAEKDAGQEYCPRMEGNTYVQYAGGALGKYGGREEGEPADLYFDEAIEERIRLSLGDETAKVYTVIK